MNELNFHTTELKFIILKYTIYSQRNIFTLKYFLVYIYIYIYIYIFFFSKLFSENKKTLEIQVNDVSALKLCIPRHEMSTIEKNFNSTFDYF